MARNANQHYVPKFYFRYFSKNEKNICVLNRDSGKTIEDASIKGQASKKYFYGDAEVENALSKIDGLFSSSLRQIKDNLCFESCTPENYVLFLQNILLQKTRTMSARKKSKEMMDRLLQLYMECEVNNDESLEEETKEGFRAIAQGLEANPVQYQKMMMSIAIECSHGLFDLLPIILHNKTNQPFIFGDAPVVFINPYLKNVKVRGVLGTQTPGLIVLYPVGNMHSIMLLDKRTYKIKRFRNSILPVKNFRDIAALNKLQIHNASIAVYFSDYQYSHYISELWREEKARLVNHRGKVVEAPGIDHNGEPMGDIIHSFEEQLPFIPRFSFLEYQELPEKEYRFSMREKYA